MNENNSSPNKPVSRRDVLKFGLAAGAVAAATVGNPFRGQTTGAHASHSAPHPPATGMEMSGHGDFSGPSATLI
jgi:hypothetical protein